jgi:hypothetical protein
MVVTVLEYPGSLNYEKPHVQQDFSVISNHRRFVFAKNTYPHSTRRQWIEDFVGIKKPDRCNLPSPAPFPSQAKEIKPFPGQ